MTFEEWFHSRGNDDEDSWHDIVWEDGPHKGRDVAKWLEIAFEDGYQAGWEDNDDMTLCNSAANRGRE